MERSNENTIMGLVPRAIALAIALVITYSVTTAFTATSSQLHAEFQQTSVSSALYATVLKAN